MAKYILEYDLHVGHNFNIEARDVLFIRSKPTYNSPLELLRLKAWMEKGKNFTESEGKYYKEMEVEKVVINLSETELIELVKTRGPITIGFNRDFNLPTLGTDCED